MLKVLTSAVGTYVSPLRLYALAAFVVMVAAFSGYVVHLHYKVEAQATALAADKATIESLRRAQVALEQTYATREKARGKAEVIKKDVSRAKEAPVPEPIATALDGLRKLQTPKPRSP